MSATVTCHSCGKPVAKGASFCAGCGTAVLQAQDLGTGQSQDVGTNPTQCGKCASPMGRDDRFCPKCGAPRPEEATGSSHVSLRNAQAAHLIRATQGEFEVIAQLGTGAMGSVYLAKDLALGRKVAIKVIAPYLLSDETMVSRFRLEAQTVASLRHPNIVNVHAVRQSDDLHYFVMEFIDGPPLRSIVKGHAPLEADVVRALLFQVGSALSYAHRSGGGVIHRDIKPANIMVDREGNAFVTDFGISKIAEAQSGLTQTGATIGTPEYMSPEQCRGESLTGASDQYALGIVAYEMLCGHTPFSGSQYYIMMAHTSEQPKPIHELRPDCPADVAESVERMLAKSPGERWPDLDSAVAAMGGAPLGYRDPTRSKIQALTGATLMQVPVVGVGSPAAAGASGGAATADTATSVTVTGLPSVLETGERFQLQAEVKGSGNTSLAGLGVQWASTNPSIAKVEGGWVEALSPGSVSITASAQNVASSVLVTVAEPAPAQVLVRPSSVRIQRGGRIGLGALVQDRRGRGLEREVRWLSSDPSIATVTGNGEVVAKESGSVTVTAESAGVKGTAEIVVETPVVERMPAPARSPAPAVLKAPARTKPLPKPGSPPRPAYGRPWYRHPGAIVAFVLGPLGVVVVGVLLMTGGGDPAPSGTEPPSAAIRTGGAVEPGADVQVPPEPTVQGPTGESPQPGSDGTPPEPEEPVSDAGADAGAPPTPGPSTVVENPPAATTPTSMTVRVATASMQVGGSQLATAQVFDSGGLRLGSGAYSLEWRSSDPAVASVDGQSGVLRASGPGTAWLVASAGAARDSVLVSVAATVVAAASVEIEGSDFTIEVGASRTLSASVIDASGARLERTVTWRSSNAGVAAVDAVTGEVSPVSAGTAQITASADGFSDQVTVTVGVPALATLPSPAAVRSAIEGYVASLGQGDGDAVTRLWGGADGQGALLDLMRERNFTATLGAVGDALLDGSTAVVSFEVVAGYRTNFGQNRSQDLSFRGRLERDGSDWQLVSCVLQ